MTQYPETSPQPGVPRGPKQAMLMSAAGLASLVVFTCALFTAVSSAFLLGGGLFLPALADPALTTGLALRVLLFTLLSAVSAFALVRAACAFKTAPAPEEGQPNTRKGRLGLALVLLIASALLFPRLDAYPRAAPDEVHHLIVAKNLAQHGVYASGHPGEYTYFDSYDSVGPPVLLPVAAALRVRFSLGAARSVMAFYFLLLCLALYALLSPVFGGGAAAAGALFALMAFSSIYLGRTLYGEVPALFYYVLGLLCWRKALAAEKTGAGMGVLAGAGMGVLAGAAFGLAILCKTIMVLSVFPILGVVLYDRALHRRILPRHLLYPMLGAAAPIVLWWAIQTLARHSVQESAAATLGLYRHYLLFGFGSVIENLQRTVVAYPLAHIVCFLGAAAAAHSVFLRRYDPPLCILILTAAFFGYWWLFFTPGQLPRYLWVMYAPSAALAGVLLVRVLGACNRATAPRRYKAAALLGAAVLLAPSLDWTLGQAKEVYGNSEMEEDHAIARYVSSLPDSARIATTFYPLRGTLSFFSDRLVTVGEEPEGLLRDHDAVILWGAGASARRMAPPGKTQAIGPYLVIENTPHTVPSED